ncbi:DUF2865 domain-containing protein [Rhodopseudomonas palustris]|uniref:DUF2865 domain-containing protein n=1 Tax=Rhodopseudomonas palustris TaxID=1076 RepID=UPI002ACE466B|nr:DUF2865 domain-containing protein [Rhodopseudomonas palustris]WQG98242.1 DUF2865 domain-containing protein [Rhodopseudomonas palustris]
MRQVFEMLRLRRTVAVAAALALAMPVVLIPSAAPAQNILEMLFGGGGPQRPQQRGAPAQANFFADPFGLNQQAAPPPPARPVASGGGPAFCVRPCDGKYFALQTRGGATPAQMCQAFCPAGNAKVYYGSNIDYATASNGQRYADSENAFAYRKALKPDCTCNGRDPAGLAQIDLSQDTSLRAGDIVATATGLAAYTGVRLGAEQTPDFTPVADYPGLTAQLRARLSEMKVAPVNDQLTEAPQVSRDVALPAPAVAQPAVRGRRAGID